MKKFFSVTYTFLIIIQCIQGQIRTYSDEIIEWRKNRVERLKDETGYLNLSGLFWLKEGISSIGSDKSNDIKFETNNTAAYLGLVRFTNGEIWFESHKNADVFHNDVKVTYIKLFPYENIPVTLQHNRIRWFVIQRGDKYAIRLRDLDGKYLKDFKGIDYYEIQYDYVVKAKFIPTPGRKITITDATGRVFEQESPGRVIFKIKGVDCSLESTGTINQLSFVFADETTNAETYGGGRFLESKGPDVNGELILDFNKAYNPPCAFNPFTTCPLPTKENFLKVEIKAGEKYNNEH